MDILTVVAMPLVTAVVGFTINSSLNARQERENNLRLYADMMTRRPDTVAPDTSAKDAARLVHESGHNRLPVVEDGRLVGVVTRLDLLGALAA